MITSFILTLIVFVAVFFLGIWIISSSNTNVSQIFGTILSVVAAFGFVIFLLTSGIGGAFGYNTYTEITTSNFDKALTTKRNAVTIVYEGGAYIFNQFDVVNNFESITNIVICNRKTVLGLEIKDIKVLIPNKDAVTLRVTQ